MQNTAQSVLEFEIEFEIEFGIQFEMEFNTAEQMHLFCLYNKGRDISRHTIKHHNQPGQYNGFDFESQGEGGTETQEGMGAFLPLLMMMKEF